MYSRRSLLSLGITTSFGVVGCAQQTLQLVKNSYESPKSDSDAFGSSRERIRSLPLASMGVRLGESPRFISVLATVNEGRYTWASADERLFVTKAGRLIQTRGLDCDLVATSWLEEDPLLKIASTGVVPAPGVYRKIELRGDTHRQADISVESKFEIHGDQTIVVLGEPKQTIKISERSRIRRWRWESHDQFWIDPSSLTIWHSYQTFSPEVGAVELEILKKPTV